MRLIVAIFMLALTIPVLAGAANELQPVASIRAAAEQAVMPPGGGLEAKAAIDERLRLPLCQQALSAHVVHTGTVEVSCPDPSGWRLFVPIQTMRWAKAVVLTRPISAGATIGADALSVETRNLAQGPADVLTDPELAIGQIARRSLPAGALLSGTDLRSNYRIRRGQMVFLVAKAPGIEVRMPGKALMDAAPGEIVTVENSVSRRQVSGVVAKSGEIEVPL